MSDQKARGFYSHYDQRILDLVLTIPALLVFSPLMVMVALLVRLRLGSPILFRQQRPGFHGQPFVLYKFRTMTDARDVQCNLLPDAERLTSLGRFLRSTSLDELPELINVLKGEMSLVGPRPLLMQYLDRYTPEQMRRHEVRPGLTGWAQVNGRNALTWEQKFALDVWYVDHQSLWLDMRIIVLTVWKTLRREGISQPGQATAQEFMGQTSGTASKSMREEREIVDFHPPLESVACELCGSTEHQVMVVEDAHLAPRMRLVKCRHCGLAFTNPRPTDAALKFVYSAENYVAHTASAEYCLTGDASREQFVFALGSLVAMVQPPAHILDVGCGAGHFLAMASRVEGWQATGVELSDYAAQEAAQRARCPVHVGTLESAAFPSESFDVVTLWYVLEHVAHPKALLGEVNRVLRPEGIVLIAVPNLRYLWIKRSLLQLMNRAEGMLHLDEHLFHYTDQTMTHLLRATGFEVIAHKVAAPFIRGHEVKTIGKYLALYGVQVMFRLTGVNFGGILIYARKKVDCLNTDTRGP